MILRKSDILDLITEETSIGSVMGSPTDPHGGFFIGPLGGVSDAILRRRIMYPTTGVKNGDGTKSRIVEPPQGRVTEGEQPDKEHLYSVDGNLITESDLDNWFGLNIKQKPLYSGGLKVAIKAKCMAFPYCAQGDYSKPLKLVKEGEMCTDCEDFINEIAEISGKKASYITELIRNKYLSL